MQNMGNIQELILPCKNKWWNHQCLVFNHRQINKLIECSEGTVAWEIENTLSVHFNIDQTNTQTKVILSNFVKEKLNDLIFKGTGSMQLKEAKMHGSIGIYKSIHLSYQNSMANQVKDIKLIFMNNNPINTSNIPTNRTQQETERRKSTNTTDSFRYLRDKKNIEVSFRNKVCVSPIIEDIDVDDNRSNLKEVL